MSESRIRFGHYCFGFGLGWAFGTILKVLIEGNEWIGIILGLMIMMVGIIIVTTGNKKEQGK